ncbi:acetate--CoA ligase family protein [Sinorhizobium terangae]|uniref:acetate--CoA ligase family protein n=1 Tax=Sinorhizobium terangae TaxID=110322 RepID=UPI0024B14FAD|nr:acetate--CoA ligase family protein [Sinorhizobium terangae]WFU49057.1 acetate--CoA ligase family protein [Sinorhizobium terangae]
MTGQIHSLPARSLLAPRSVAFVGVSAKGGAGNKMLNSALRSGFEGKIWPVNANAAEIAGVSCVPSLSALPAVPDCIVISVPAEGVLALVEEAAAIGVRAALVVSEGFADAGTPEGRERQERLAAIAKVSGMAVAGPNCMGIATLAHRFAATMADIPAKLDAGGISLVSQSGGLLNAVAELSANRGIGMNYLISIGNQAVLDLADYIDFLADDPKTSVIACIMEGAKDGRRFRAAVERASRIKPLVILKLGQSTAGQAATFAHTGTLAGRHEAYEALFRANGVAAVSSLDELVETAALLATAPLPAGNRVCLLTVSGGATSLIGDLGERAGVSFGRIDEETSRRVGEALGVSRDFGNPLDTVGMPRLRQEGAIEGVVGALLDSAEIDVIGLVLGMRLEGAENHDKLVARMAEIARTASKPLLVLSFISNSLTAHWRGYAMEHGLPLVEDVELGLRAIRHLTDYGAFRQNMSARREPPQARRASGDVSDGVVFSEAESKRILGRAGLPVTREYLAKTPKEAKALTERIGGRVALKIQSRDIPHKSDVGGVHLGATVDDAETMSQKILTNAKTACPEAAIDGILVQEMVGEGAEFIIGMTYDEQFGPLVVVGGGGVMVEVFKDASVGLAPLTRQQATEMVARLKISVRLDGFRGAPPLDREALIDCLVAFSNFVASTDGQLAAIDLNPVFVRTRGRGVKIADALIITTSLWEEDNEQTETHYAFN